MNQRAKEFNARIRVGQPVHIELDNGTLLDTYLASEAWDLGNGTAVAKVEGKRGGWSIERISLRDADC